MAETESVARKSVRCELKRSGRETGRFFMAKKGNAGLRMGWGWRCRWDGDGVCAWVCLGQGTMSALQFRLVFKADMIIKLFESSFDTMRLLIHSTVN